MVGHLRTHIHRVTRRVEEYFIIEIYISIATYLGKLMTVYTTVES